MSDAYIPTEAIPMLVGRKIKAIRPISNSELDEEGWTRRDDCMVIELDNGAKVYPSCDTESNGPGCLFGVLADGTQILVI
ncbi:MAG: hypothetical protein AAGI37_14130 [Planctomycetota bacterium]